MLLGGWQRLLPRPYNIDDPPCHLDFSYRNPRTNFDLPLQHRTSQPPRSSSAPFRLAMEDPQRRRMGSSSSQIKPETPSMNGSW